jgi:lipoprotein-releasing system permease protein
MAMVVTLSVFNGFSDLVASFFTAFDPQLKIVPVEGKTVAADDPALIKIKTLDEVAVATECVEDQAMAVYHGRQAMMSYRILTSSSPLMICHAILTRRFGLTQTSYSTVCG